MGTMGPSDYVALRRYLQAPPTVWLPVREWLESLHPHHPPTIPSLPLEPETFEPWLLQMAPRQRQIAVTVALELLIDDLPRHVGHGFEADTARKAVQELVAQTREPAFWSFLDDVPTRLVSVIYAINTHVLTWNEWDGMFAQFLPSPRRPVYRIDVPAFDAGDEDGASGLQGIFASIPDDYTARTAAEWAEFCARWMRRLACRLAFFDALRAPLD